MATSLAVGLFAALAAPPATAARPIQSIPAAQLAGLELGESMFVSDWPIDEPRHAGLVFTRIEVWYPEARVVVVGANGAMFEQPRPARRHLIGRAVPDPAVAVVLRNGFSVGSGARFMAALDPSLALSP